MKKIIALLIIFTSLAPSLVSAGTFDESPFADIYNPDAKCWRGVVHLIGPSEQVVLQGVKTETRNSYLAATGVNSANLPSYAPFVIETSSSALYDSVAKKYHYFAAAVYPMPGISADCVKAVPPASANTKTTPEGVNVVSQSEVGKAAAAAAAAGAGAIGSGATAGGMAGSNPNPDTPGDIKGTPLYSGSSNSTASSASDYKPGPSGLAADCNRGELSMQYSTGKDGLQKGDVAFANNCDFNDLMTLINKVINFLLFVIATPLVAIGVCYAGFLYVFSGGSSEKTGQAKGILMNLVIGYIVALVAWVAVKTIMVSLGFDSTGIFLEI